jgi:hypothetical protein
MSLDDVTIRILDRIDDLQEQLASLCTEQTIMKTQLEEHFKDLVVTEKNKEKKFYYVIALMGVGFTIVQLLQAIV